MNNVLKAIAGPEGEIRKANLEEHSRETAVKMQIDVYVAGLV